ncbi:MAG: hypothetical protein ACXAC7_00300, partial [Candidatus Hodarchaeales archaeon]
MNEIPDYWINPLLTDINIEISKIKPNKLILSSHQPIFQGGGGQPPDQAVVYLPGYSDSIMVKEILSNAIKLDLLESWNPPSLPFSIQVTINKDFRLAVMRAHTAQHLLSALLLQEFNIKTMKAAINPDSVHLFFDRPMSIDTIAPIMELFHSYIVNPIPVKSHILRRGETKDINGTNIDLSNLRGSIPDDSNWIRVVAIGDNVDLNTCGGTHLSSTGLIHDFYVTDMKKKELKFVCGISATKLRASIIQELITLSKRLKIPLKESLPHIQEQLKDYRELQKTLTIFTKRNLHTMIILLKDKLINL